MDSNTEKELKRELKVHAKALGIPAGAADSFINETIKSVKTNLKKKTVITTQTGLRRTYSQAASAAVAPSAAAVVS